MKNYFLPLIALICFPIAAFPATTHYVDLNCTNPVSPYTDWSTAATNIQDAVDASTDGDVVLVTNGIYAEVNNLHLAINKAITVQSVNGPDATAILGPTNAINRNSGGCVYLTSGATLIGFTLTNGIIEGNGGGAWCESASAVISNCILTHCQAYYGGGAYGGTLANCIISNNLAVEGGGAYGGTLANCVLIANTATSSPDDYDSCYGGGAYNSSLTHCMVISNSADRGGGVCEGAKIDYRGSGVYSTLDNCLLIGNSGGGAVYAGGFVPTILNNCTICNNSGGGLAFNPTTDSLLFATNCIVWGNNTPSWWGFSNYEAGVFDHCCTAPLPISGVGNIANDPLFVNPAAGDFHLQSTSPCINSGNNACVTNSTDLDGNPRIVGGTVDMGAYEFQKTIHYVDINSSNATAPYLLWSTAATNIQDAVNASTDGDVVLVTNGIYPFNEWYPTSGLGMVAVTNAITVQSVNGPTVTVIKRGIYTSRCVYLGTNAILSGFTLTNGFVQFSGGYGGGLYMGTDCIVSNCIITGNLANDGGNGVGIFMGTGCIANDCIITGNSNYLSGEAIHGAGLYMGAGCVASNCIITGNSAGSSGLGGGSYSTNNALLINCIISGNTAGGAAARGGGDCGGAYGNYLVNCVLSNNAANRGGGIEGGTAVNCLFVGNVGFGGAAYYSTLDNCTIVSNSFAAYACSLANSIIYYNTNVDCYQCSLTNCCTSSLLNNNSAVNCITNEPLFENLAGGDFHLSLSSPCINAGDNSFVTNSTDLDGNPRIVGGTVDMGAYEFQRTIHYVDINSSNATAPYLLWSTAATNIQDAVDASTDGDVVLVTNGIYAEVNNLHLAINKAITVQSVNGPNATAILGPADAINRNNGGCVYLTNGATLIGFTLTNGIIEGNGGGAWCESASAVISNCILTHCQAYYGGGAYGGTLANCIISNNLAVYGGGAYSSVLINCVLIANTATSSPADYQYCYGGGACNSSLTHCMVISNSADRGGGVCEGDNIDYRGSGVYSTLDNCLLIGNSGGGAVYAGIFVPTILNNCTICNNSSGGLAYNETAYPLLFATNCIVWGNNTPSWWGFSNYEAGVFDHCCTAPLPISGVGNIANDPLFVNPAAGDFHLQSTSPCINSGNNACVTNSTDLDGNPRIVGGTVDIGCYEYQSPSSVISYAYLQQYGLPTDGSADYTNLNGTAFNVYKDWIAGLNPLDPNSVLAMSAPAMVTNSAGITVTWQSVNTRTYFLQRSTNLAAQPAFSSIQSNIVGQAGTTSYTDSAATNSIPYFYRVGVQ